MDAGALKLCRTRYAQPIHAILQSSGNSTYATTVESAVGAAQQRCTFAAASGVPAPRAEGLAGLVDAEAVDAVLMTAERLGAIAVLRLDCAREKGAARLSEQDRGNAAQVLVISVIAHKPEADNENLLRSPPRCDCS